jgi:Transposase, Mutator family
MADTSMVARKREGDPPASPPLVDEELVDQLLGKAKAEGVELLGPDGLLSQVTKAVLERALAEEMTGHLGYEKHDPAGRGSGNSRNGSTTRAAAEPAQDSQDLSWALARSPRHRACASASGVRGGRVIRPG